MKREDYINWDEYFMGIALLTAMRSKDPNSQVGACIVSPENKILSLGYNGMPMGCSDDEMPWEREGAPLQTKYMYVCHAELNAILNSAHNNLKGARVYVTLFPCNECAKAIIDVGVDARDTVGPDRAAQATQVHDLLDDKLAREAGEEAERDGVDTHLLKGEGHVEALAVSRVAGRTGADVLVGLERRARNRHIDGRISG